MSEEISRAEKSHKVVDKRMEAALEAYQRKNPRMGLGDLFALFNELEATKAHAAKRPASGDSSQVESNGSNEAQEMFRDNALTSLRRNLLEAYPPINHPYALPMYGVLSVVLICGAGFIFGW